MPISQSSCSRVPTKQAFAARQQKLLSARAQAAQRATWMSVWVNLALTFLQLLVGWLSHSQALVAHGLHSFSDLLSDFLVIFASRQSSHPADERHPYGHARMETAATLVLGISLLAVGGGIVYECVERWRNAGDLPALNWWALAVAVLTVVGKEGLYHFLKKVARRLRSQLLLANAMHTRADAASALVVVLGIGGALLGWIILDLIAAALMGAMILHMGGELAWKALSELIDTGLDAEHVDEIALALKESPDVLGIHDLRTRRMAGNALVDAHIQVDPRISVSEGHRIAEAARQRVLQKCPLVLDVLVHIDPDDGLDDPDEQWQHLPDRTTLLSEMAPILAGLPKPEKITLHYINAKVEVDVHLSASVLRHDEELQRLNEALNFSLPEDGPIGEVCVLLKISRGDNMS